MIKFSSYIKRQANRDDLIGDFAKDFRDIEKRPLWAKRSGVKEFKSETLYGLYKHLPMSARDDEEIINIAIDIWKEWLQSNHIGLRFNDAKKGYVYFFKIQDQIAFKVGRTKRHPEARKVDVQSEAKVPLITFNWMYIRNYDVIENELKKAFMPYRYSREWYNIDEMHVNEAILLYQKTDPQCGLYRDITERERFLSEVQDAVREQG